MATINKYITSFFVFFVLFLGLRQPVGVWCLGVGARSCLPFFGYVGCLGGVCVPLFFLLWAEFFFFLFYLFYLFIYKKY